MNDEAKSVAKDPLKCGVVPMPKKCVHPQGHRAVVLYDRQRRRELWKERAA
jgi:hypothetical protein